jgi:hypothetical protein
MWQTKFHIHIKEQTKLIIHKFQQIKIWYIHALKYMHHHEY